MARPDPDAARNVANASVSGKDEGLGSCVTSVFHEHMASGIVVGSHRGSHC